MTYITTIGNFGAIGDGYSHSIVADVAVTDELNYVFQSDYVETDEDVLGSGSDDYEAYGINNYLLYALNDLIGLGLRAEWWEANSESYFEVTGGVNFMPIPNLKIRPELRYQWGSDGNSDSGQVTADNPAGLPLDEGVIFGMDAILTF